MTPLVVNEAVFEVEARIARRQCLLQLGHEPRPVIRMDVRNPARQVAEVRLAIDSQQRQLVAVERQSAAGKIEIPHDDLRDLHRHVQVALRVLACGDVARQHDEARNLVALCRLARDRQLEPEAAAGELQRILAAHRLPHRLRLLQRRQADPCCRLRQDLVDGPSDERVGGGEQQPGVRGVIGVDATDLIDFEQQVGNGVERALQRLSCGLDFRAGALRLGDIAPGADQVVPPLQPDRRDADLHVQRGAVLAPLPTVELRATVRREPGSDPAQCDLVQLALDGRQRRVDELVAPVAQHPARGIVDLYDAQRLHVDEIDPVRRLAHDRAIELLPLGEFRLGADLLRDVLEAPDAPRIAPDRQAAGVTREDPTIFEVERVARLVPTGVERTNPGDEGIGIRKLIAHARQQDIVAAGVDPLRRHAPQVDEPLVHRQQLAVGGDHQDAFVGGVQRDFQVRPSALGTTRQHLPLLARGA